MSQFYLKDYIQLNRNTYKHLNKISYYQKIYQNFTNGNFNLHDYNFKTFILNPVS